MWKDLIARAKQVLADITGQAARDAEAVVDDLEVAVADAHAQAVTLLAQAKTEISAALAAAAPEVKAEVEAIITRIEAAIQSVLGHIPGA